MEDLLQRNDQLRADIRLGGVGEDGDQACADRGLFVVGDGRGGGGDAVGFGPALVDAVLEVDGRWEWECQWVSLKSREGNGDHTLDSRSPVSCSASRMFSRASRKPGVSSAYTQCNTTSQSNFLTSIRINSTPTVPVPQHHHSHSLSYRFEVQLCLPANVRICIKRGLNAAPQTGSIHGQDCSASGARGFGGGEDWRVQARVAIVCTARGGYCVLQ